jgi:hypothetical protein
VNGEYHRAYSCQQRYRAQVNVDLECNGIDQLFTVQISNIHICC